MRLKEGRGSGAPDAAESIGSYLRVDTVVRAAAAAEEEPRIDVKKKALKRSAHSQPNLVPIAR